MSSAIGHDTAVCLVISQLQQHTDTSQIEQCWEILKECLGSWLVQSVSTEQRLSCFEEISQLKRYHHHRAAVCQLFGDAAIEQDNFVDANHYLSKVLCESTNVIKPELFETVSNIRNNLVVRWSFRMLNDIRRNFSYRTAINNYIAQSRDDDDCVVVDLGAGTGILSVYAANAGASKVFAIEQDDVMNGICKAVTAGENRIEVVLCSSKDFDVESNHVDLVITETLDSIGIGEGVVSSCYNLALRSSNPNLHFIPSHISLQGFLIHSQTLHLSSFCGNFRTKVGTAEEPYCCEFLEEYEDTIALSAPTNILKVKLGSTFDQHISILEVPVTSDGWCDGVCSYFSADLFKDTTITSAPKLIKTNDARMGCWEQGYHPLPRRYVRCGEVVKIKVEKADEISVILSWVGDQQEYTVVKSSQIKLLNSSFARSLSNELLNVIPKVLDVGGLIIADPFRYVYVKSISFHGHVINCEKLLLWSQVHPPALCLGKSKESETLTLEMNKYQTMVHENIPLKTLEHAKLSDSLQLLKIFRLTLKDNSRRIEFQSLAPLSPTALVFWTEIELNSGAMFSTASEPLWRPAAIVFGSDVRKSEWYELSVCFSGASLSAAIKAL